MIESNKNYCMCNLELMKQMDDNSVDLIYADILYGTGRTFEHYVDLNFNMKDLVFGIIPKIIYDFYNERIEEFHRILKKSGSIYIHMDNRIKDCIKLLMNKTFGVNNFINEVIWCYKSSLTIPKIGFVNSHDTIFLYSKNIEKVYFNENIRKNFKTSEHVLERMKKYANKDGKVLIERKTFKGKKSKYTTDISSGLPIDWWNISNVSRGGNKEVKCGKYATQKPIALLERIIKASSNEGDVVFDPFLGSGTTIVVANQLNRKWIGCDINPYSIELTEKRLKEKQIVNKTKIDKLFNL